MNIQLSVYEEKTYNETYRKHATGLRNHLYYKYGDMARAEDIVQEAFLRLFKICSTIIYEKVVSFLYKVSNNLVLDNIRSQNVALKFEKGLITVSDNEDPYFHLRTKEFRLKIEAVISSLPEKQREAFLLNRIDKFTFKEIAIRLDISETAVEKRIAKALIKLKATITELKEHPI